MAGSIAGTNTIKDPMGGTFHNQRGNDISFLLHTNP